MLPELGGKLQTLRLTGSGHNVLLEPPEYSYRRASPGAAFDQFDTSGFDECFPTVGACEHAGVLHADHGALWSAPWSFERESASAAVMRAGASGQLWTFARRMVVRKATLRLEYEVQSTSTAMQEVLWSAHPLLSVSERSRVVLPPSVREMQIESSAGDRLGKHGAKVAWPVPDIATLVGPRSRSAEKLFCGPLPPAQTEAALHDARSGVVTTLRFDAGLTPYLGLWVSQGGWPEDPARRRHFTVALEPTSSPVDSLAEAAGLGAAWRLAPEETKRWIVEVSLSRSSSAG